MRETTLRLVLLFTVIGVLARGNEPADQQEVDLQQVEQQEKLARHVTAQLGDGESNKNQQIYLYSKHPLKEISFSADGKTWSYMTPLKKQGDFHVFGSQRLPAEAEEGHQYKVQGLLADGGLFTDQLTIVPPKGEEDEILSVDVENVKKVSREENYNSRNPVLPYNEIVYGAPTIPPQTLAQARVNYMAARNLSGHLGGQYVAGSLQTTHGTLSEGWGAGGSPLCGTCAGSGPCYADAHCRTASGGYQRIRFYKGGTWSNSSGGGRRGRRR